jgi:hypothetical protein
MEDILDAIPEPPLVVNMRMGATQAVYNTPILPPEDASKFNWGPALWAGDYPTVTIAYNDGSGLSGRWPVADMRQFPGGTVRLLGPRGVADIAHAEEELSEES